MIWQMKITTGIERCITKSKCMSAAAVSVFLLSLLNCKGVSIKPSDVGDVALRFFFIWVGGGREKGEDGKFL